MVSSVPRPVALVTGGAVRIGRIIAERLAAEGYDIAIHARKRSEQAEALVATLAVDGRRAVLVEADLADAAAVETILPQVVAALGPVELLVNSASMFEHDDATGFTVESWDRQFAVNLRAPALLMRDMATALPEDRQGAIVNIVDQRVLRLNPHFTSYTLAKAALWTATQTFAMALAPRIRVNAIGPGPTLQGARQSDADFRNQWSTIPLAHPVPPAEIAETVLYLARMTSVTGQLIAVDSGQHLAWQTPDAFAVE